MTETLRTATQRAELWVKEREGLVAMLGEAKEALAAAQAMLKQQTNGPKNSWVFMAGLELAEEAQEEVLDQR